MSVLVTGGAGYIGSHVVHRLAALGRAPVVIDSLVTGHRDAVPEGVPFLEADVADRARVAGFIGRHGVRAVLHFAALSQVGESVAAPRAYFQGNLVASLALLETVLDAGVPSFVLSSTAAVYGTPDCTPIPESHPTRPINPYGVTKLAIEHALGAYHAAYGLRYAALRYFNAAGAEPSAGLGERHEPESHLIPLVLRVALGLRPHVTVYGSDYDTPDGTCVRDYIHVADLAEAHVMALDYLEAGGDSGAFNLGTGRGYSVQEVVDAARRVTGRELPVVYGERRAGDPAALVASPRLAEARLGFQARRSGLDEIVRDAWDFHRGFSPP
ncbi:MAG: UDP-glucose 4-epimerase [Myxococcaceae bacterium]|nr:UDP-glucose 4-epimerase [Myxococcaceae bacterium]